MESPLSFSRPQELAWKRRRSGDGQEREAEYAPAKRVANTGAQSDMNFQPTDTLTTDNLQNATDSPR
jgi:hypothetical protein